jgi:hypothetical protein
LTIEGGMEKLEKLHQEAKAKGYIVIGMTNSADEEIEKLRKNMALLLTSIPVMQALKTIERANPSIVVLEEGTIKQSSSQRHRRSKTINSPEV